MTEIAIREAIVHGVLAAAFVEALLRAWRIERAESRLPFWWLALAFPFLFSPACIAIAPFRTQDWFSAGWALFSSARWNAVRPAGLPLDIVVLALLGAAGALLLLRDAVPFLFEAWKGRRGDIWPHLEPPADLVRLVGELSDSCGVRAPALDLVNTDTSVFFVRGLIRYRIVMSSGALGALSADELRAAVAHELAHVRFRDPLTGWVLLAARVAMAWNPAVQLVARAIVQELERRADSSAAAAAGPAALAAALLRLSQPASRPGALPRARMLRTITERMDRENLRTRSAALLGRPAPASRLPVRLALGASALAVLSFFVV